jgi:uncharacterized membrane protein
MPAWALTLVFWLHMLATVIWLGGLSAIGLLVLPAAQRSLALEAQTALLDAIQRRLEPLGWFCLALLAATGMFQMSENRDYAGFLSVHNPWSIAILIKHILYLSMLGVTALQTWEVLPAMRLAMLKTQKTGDTQELSLLAQRQKRLLHINLILSALILGATALARVA